MSNEEKRKLLERQLLKLKKEGLRVFICKNEEYHYGLISDGMHLVGIQMQPFGPVFSLYYKYVPNNKYGSCVSERKYENYNGRSEISMEDYISCKNFGHAFVCSHNLVAYKDLNKYMDKEADYYIEL